MAFPEIREIKKIIDMLQETDVSEIELTNGGESVRITRHSNQPIIQQTMSPVHHQPITPPTVQESVTPQATLEVPVVASGHNVYSPMVGTFYASPSPDAKPFVTLGQHVNNGDTLCLIEAMKMFNEVEADKSGKITAILVDTGKPVEFNQPLFVIE
jgi:acetyl-CoA carboxylase biotin carboxyl carrier protein